MEDTHVITQEDIDAMEDGMDKYEEAWLTAEGKLSESADRIAQLERELAEAHKTQEDAFVALEDMAREWAAEKALADRLYNSKQYGQRDPHSDDAYRKARGL